MAVYTEVSFDEASAFLRELQLGTLCAMDACRGGIENTNYFVTTDRGAYVLTLFERLDAEQLPFYLGLMKHLAARAIPVPDPAPDAQGRVVHQLRNKPAAVVNRLHGASVLDPEPGHCAQLGSMLARMHLAGRDFPLVQPNLRGLQWWNATVPVVLPFLPSAQAELLQNELAYQNQIAAEASFQALPRGPVHADLFRDNAMFTTGPEGSVLTGLFDFYFAGVDSWLFDIAVCLNDWCIDWASGAHDSARARALLEAYGKVRPLGADERQWLPAVLRAAALRFWLSRLWDLHLPRAAALLQAHDPQHFQRVLLARVQSSLTWGTLFP